MAHSGPELGESTKPPINATAGIGRLYKIQGSFIILLGVYCEIFSGRTR